MCNDLKGINVTITGASSGIEKAVALRLWKEKMKAAFNYVSSSEKENEVVLSIMHQVKGE